MGSGQSQNPRGGQMGGMGQPGGIPGGGIAGLAPQMGGQMGGFGQMVNQAVSQPGMAAPGGGFSPMTNMGGFMGGNPAMPAPGGMPPQTGAGGQMLDQAAMQAAMQAQMQQRGMGGQMPRPQGGPLSTMVNPPRPMPVGQTQGGQMGGMGPKRPMSPNVPSTMQRGMPQGIAAMFKGRR